MIPSDKLCAETLIGCALHDPDIFLSLSDTEDEEPLLEPTRNREAIMAAFNQCDEELLDVWLGDLYKGSFLLIWNNGSEDEPMVLVADHTDNLILNDIWARTDHQVSNVNPK